MRAAYLPPPFETREWHFAFLHFTEWDGRGDGSAAGAGAGEGFFV